ncbi:MAG: hypothetical protein GXY52_09555 [Chloroflexi bacterium]|nr:hypothetical protein [Chloroflexota bacterium]
MPQIGRNDPCPCGSGRKYKSCCLIHDRITEQRDLAIGKSEAALLTYLFNYARQPRFNQEMVEAFNAYWGGAYDPAAANAIGPENMRRYFEWFVHDYPTLADRRFVIDLYAEMAEGRLEPDYQQLLDAWRASTMGLYRVAAKEPDDNLLLIDVLRGTELTVTDAVYQRNAVVGDLLIGRVYTLNDQPRLSHMTMALPAAYEAELSAYLVNAYRNYSGEAGTEASWDTFLRAHSMLFSAFLLSERSTHLRRNIGPGSPYADPAIGRDKLVEESARLANARRQAEAARRQGQAGTQRTASGIILPGAPPAPPEEAPVPERPSTILIPGRDD